MILLSGDIQMNISYDDGPSQDNGKYSIYRNFSSISRYTGYKFMDGHTIL
jgi:hypothetical protein